MTAGYYLGNEDALKALCKPHAEYELKARQYDRVGMSYFEIPTIEGDFCLCCSAFGVGFSFFPGTDDFDVMTKFDYYQIGLSSSGVRRVVEAGVELNEYLVGAQKAFSSPIDTRFLSPLQQAVFAALRTVPFGQTVTVGELAERAGHKGKGGAVARIVQSNPCPIFLPCHRVTTSKGWAGADHYGWRAWLQAFEGIGGAALSLNTEDNRESDHQKAKKASGGENL